MEQKILNYSISLAFCLLLSLPLQAQNSDISAPPANTPPKKEKKEAKEEVHYPLYNGISVSVDLWGPGSKLFGSDFFSSEVAVDVNLKNRFFPIVELGYGNTDTWSDKGIHYKTGAPYFRIGNSSFFIHNSSLGCYLIFNVIIVIAASTMVTIQKRTVIFDSWNNCAGWVNTTLQPGSIRFMPVRKWSCIGVRLKRRCLTPFRLPAL